MKAVNLLSRILKAALLLIFSMTLSFGQSDLFTGKRKVSKKRVYKCHEIGKQKHQSRKFSKKEARPTKQVAAIEQKESRERIFIETFPVMTESNVELYAQAFKAEEDKVEKEFDHGTFLPLPNPVYFRFDTDELTYEDLHQITLAVEHIRQGKNIILEGHTDSHGAKEYNMSLSMRRAHKIKKMMIEMGQVSGDAISVRYFGEEKPAVENDSHENRQLNRRVEFIVLN